MEYFEVGFDTGVTGLDVLVDAGFSGGEVLGGRGSGELEEDTVD